MSIYVAIDKKTTARLIELARRERRRPADQAALFVEQGLRALDEVERDSQREPEPKRDPAPA